MLVALERGEPVNIGCVREASTTVTARVCDAAHRRVELGTPFTVIAGTTITRGRTATSHEEVIRRQAG
jgi:hypothetical protein